MSRRWAWLSWLAMALCAVCATGSDQPPHAHDPVVATPSTGPFENSLGMKFVSVPGIEARFCIWETRVKDYAVFCSATRRAWVAPDFAQTPEHAVVNVSWEDATAFCAWLTAKERKEGRLTTTQRYRLPTDHEWSAAVGLGAEHGPTPEERMKTQVVWPWGHYWPPLAGDGNYGPELKADGFPQTAPVGSFKSNRFGLFDLGGNVWEWCDDWYNPASVTRTLRGGSFNDAMPSSLLAAYRFSGTMNLTGDDIGFRFVVEILPAPRSRAAAKMRLELSHAKPLKLLETSPNRPASGMR